jgi:hypothetical protein
VERKGVDQDEKKDEDKMKKSVAFINTKIAGDRKSPIATGLSRAKQYFRS